MSAHRALSCREVAERLALLGDDTLASDEGIAIEAHLAGCAGCRAFREQLDVVAGALGRWGRETASDENVARVIATVRETRSGRDAAAAAPTVSPDATTRPPAGGELDAPPMIASGDLLAGRYRVERMLGQGGMGTVWIVEDTAVRERVALKTFDVERVDHPDRFRREVRLARRITHRNVIRAFDLGMHGAVTYLTMELVEGTDLRRTLRARGPLPLAEAVEVALQICAGLGAAHDAGVVHRDLTPGNVLIEKSGRVVLTDFGIARSLRDDDGVQTLGALGTPAYMAPEQLAGERVDARADLWALGVLLYEMLTGARPLGAGISLHARVSEDVVPPPSPHLPPALEALVTRLLRRDPAARPSSTGEVASALREAGHAPVSTGGPTVAPRAGPALPDPGPRIAVMPFEWRGPSDHAYLAAALAEELADVLSRTRGLRVLAAAATAHLAAERDPLAVARELRAASLVHVTLQAGTLHAGRGDRVRIAARLIDVASGEQRWADRFDAPLGEALAVQDAIAMRVGEALRVEISAAEHRGDAPPEAVDLYLRGRQKLSALQVSGPDGAFGDLDRCVALAPGFRPAVAARAFAAARAWFGTPEDASSWREITLAAVARALAEAPAFPDTHLADATVAAEAGELRRCVAALSRALEIAPTLAHAHDYLASLELQAGSAERGLQRARLAADVDPRVFVGLLDAARHHVLHGRTAEMAALCAEAEARGAGGSIVLLQLRMRVAAWSGDARAAAELGERIAAEVPHVGALGPLYQRALRGEDVSAGTAALAASYQGHHRRFLTLIHQLAAECHALAGDPRGALRWASGAADLALIDLEWLDLCPPLDAMRGLPEFAALRARVQTRADALWAL